MQYQTVKLEIAMYKALKHEAAKEGRKLSWLLAQAVAEYLMRRKK